MLHGRAAELAVIDALLADARTGRSAVVVVSGVAGIGKTALLDHAAATANVRVARCTGVESETELPFAALHQLLRVHLDLLDTLPRPQATALRAAFGLAQVSGADRFLVGLATLTLLAELADGGPLLCAIDDAQWVDASSMDALRFAAHRLDGEGVVMMFASRETAAADRSLPRPSHELRLSGLDEHAAGVVLDEQAPDTAPHLRTRLLAAADGNPLALVELAGALRASQAEAAVDAMALTVTAPSRSSRVQVAFAAQVDRLPAATGRLLLVAALHDTGDAVVILAAAARLGAELADLRPAEHAQLVVLEGTTLSFRHPLVRSAVLAQFTGTERIAAHRALADSLDGPEHQDRRVWHLVGSTVMPDEAVAAELEIAADRALARTGTP